MSFWADTLRSLATSVGLVAPKPKAIDGDTSEEGHSASRKEAEHVVFSPEESATSFSNAPSSNHAFSDATASSGLPPQHPAFGPRRHSIRKAMAVAANAKSNSNTSTANHSSETSHLGLTQSLATLFLALSHGPRYVLQ